MAYAAELDRLLYQMQNFLVLCFLFAALFPVLALLLVLPLQIFPVLILLQVLPLLIILQDFPVLVLLQALLL